MSETIERVAKAIYDASNGLLQSAEAGRCARAAVEAMRDPIIGKLAEREAMYLAKAERLRERGLAEDDDYTRADLATHAAEATAWAAGELGALFNAALAEPPK